MSEEIVNEDDYIKVGEARAEFGISHTKMTKLLKTGALPFIADKLDERIKWLKRSDIIRLSAASLKRQRQAVSSNSSVNTDDRISNENGRSQQGDGAVANLSVQAVRRRGKSKAKGSKLTHSDKKVFSYLESICDPVTNLTPPVGIGTVAKGSDVSRRQVQISCDNLEQRGLIRRMGYDPGHPDLTKRGMVYKVLLRRTAIDSLKLVS